MNELQLLNVTLGIVASLATILGAVWVNGRGESVRWLSDRLGADLYDLSGGWETALERENDAALIGAYEERISEDDHLRHAGNSLPAGPLIEIALGEDGTPREERLGEHLSDEELSLMLDERNLWPDPIENVAQLEDSRSHAYAWVLSDDATEEDRASLATEIEETFVQLNQSDPEALHVVVRGVEEVKELDAETIENYVKPWLKESQHNGGKEENN